MSKKKGHTLYITESYSVFVKGANNFDEAKKEWDDLALDSPNIEIVKYYEDDVWDWGEIMDKIMDKLTDNIILFRNLVSEIDISKYEQTEYISVVNSIYYEIFIAQEEE